MRGLNAEERYVLEAATSGRDTVGCYFTILRLIQRGLLYETNRIELGDEVVIDYLATSTGCLVLRCTKMLDAIF